MPAAPTRYGAPSSGLLTPPPPLLSTCVEIIVVRTSRWPSSRKARASHPRAHERAFVLAPWHDLEPDAELMEFGPVAKLLEQVGDQGVVKREDLTLDL